MGRFWVDLTDIRVLWLQNCTYCADSASNLAAFILTNFGITEEHGAMLSMFFTVVAQLC